MTEEDVKYKYIMPALERSGWDKSHITMETQITDGAMKISGNTASRGKAKKADVLLYLNSAKPIAVVEAKSLEFSVSHGLQQAMEYAKMLDVKFAYSSNGKAFFEHDFLTGLEREISLDNFPTPEELWSRYEIGMKVDDPVRRIIEQSYYTGQNCYAPRYYQRNAVNRTVERIAAGRKRLLLVMATGTGKTYTAFQIVWRLLKAGIIHKVLYLADRNILVDQSISQDFEPLKNTIHKIEFSKDTPAKLASYEVFFSLYQQLSRSEDEETDSESDATLERLAELFDPDFFDLVIVDECHRGSAKSDSAWRKILEYFESAVQIGMTATPKESKEVSNIHYFGEPVYTYSLREGIDDGFLAPFRVYNIQTNIGEGWRPYKGQTDKNGNLIEDRIYNNKDYDYNIVIDARTEEVAKAITAHLKSTDRMQKTIVFCANEDHAERMRIALCNCNADMVKKNPDYVVRITGSDEYGKSKLEYFISVSEPYPVIATTSKLLSTGADCKMTKLIVLDENIGSMTEFKQIIGRGTRLREADGKKFFEILDFRNVTHLFADADWDGPIEQVDGYDPEKAEKAKQGKKDGEDGADAGDGDIGESVKKFFVGKDGCKVEIIGKQVSVYDAEGKLLRYENVIDYTKRNLLGEYTTLETFLTKWTEADKKAAIREQLAGQGIDLDALKAERNLADVDDFDFICHVAYGAKPLTRKERANNVKKRDFFSKYSGVARKVLEGLLECYMNTGIYDVENLEILKNEPFNRLGSLAGIIRDFGGKQNYLSAVKELEELLYGAS